MEIAECRSNQAEKRDDVKNRDSLPRLLWVTAAREAMVSCCHCCSAQTAAWTGPLAWAEAAEALAESLAAWTCAEIAGRQGRTGTLDRNPGAQHPMARGAIG